MRGGRRRGWVRVVQERLEGRGVRDITGSSPAWCWRTGRRRSGTRRAGCVQGAGTGRCAGCRYRAVCRVPVPGDVQGAGTERCAGCRYRVCAGCRYRVCAAVQGAGTGCVQDAGTGCVQLSPLPVAAVAAPRFPCARSGDTKPSAGTWQAEPAHGNGEDGSAEGVRGARARRICMRAGPGGVGSWMQSRQLLRQQTDAVWPCRSHGAAEPGDTIVRSHSGGRAVTSPPYSSGHEATPPPEEKLHF
ncbi:uncharacterized protein [Agelaius tricolor]|uniref:uncharacterized protein n=1 Tax=Agelaius tricolor TaxID=9191 RepID=UPI0039F1B478